MSSAVAVPSLTMKLPCVSEIRAPPTARPFRPARSTSAPAEAGMPAGMVSRPGSGFWKMQPALGLASGWVRFRYASDRRASARSAVGSPGDTRQSAQTRISPDFCRRLVSYANAICEPGMTLSSPAGVARRTWVTRSPMLRPCQCALPKIAPPTVPGVPAQASRAASPRPIVHRTRPLMVTPASARTVVSSG